TKASAELYLRMSLRKNLASEVSPVRRSIRGGGGVWRRGRFTLPDAQHVLN
ncbi:2414_t:CDS:1, partial [Acaulospora morrowiae]